MDFLRISLSLYLSLSTVVREGETNEEAGRRRKINRFYIYLPDSASSRIGIEQCAAESKIIKITTAVKDEHGAWGPESNFSVTPWLVGCHH